MRCTSRARPGPPKLSARMVESGIPVLGHIGITKNNASFFPVESSLPAKDPQVFARHDPGIAMAMAKAGAFALIVECCPVSLVKSIPGVWKYR